MLRRTFVSLLVGGLLAVLGGCRPIKPGAARKYEFRHGVASGDPLQHGVIIWTRVSGAESEPVTVNWQVATDPEMTVTIASGAIVTGPDRDYTVKADVRGLPPGRRLYYRFSVGGSDSPLGRTRTLPEGSIEKATFAVVSCSNYPTGYFHAYREIARRDDVDAVLHLGDYLYEYGLGEYGTEYAEALGRIPEPTGELSSLADYRRRHAQYKADPDSREMLAAHPLIAVWDDHEIANDAWRDGAENHDEGEGDWQERARVAIQAYLEWMPVRATAAGHETRIFRDFRYGDLLTLIMLDTRIYGRDRQPIVSEDMRPEDVAAVLGDTDRDLLGAVQSSWLRDTLADADATTWQVLGQQVLVSPVRAPDLEPLLDPDGPTPLSPEFLESSIRMSKQNPPILLDTWDGYAAARERLLADLRSAANPVILSGDLHTSIAGNLVPAGAEEPVAVEFMTTSVTSPGFAEYLPERRPGAVRDATLEMNPDLAYMETDRRGWLCMTFTRTDCTGEWHLLDGIRSADYHVTVDKRLAVQAGRVAEGLQPV